MRVSDARAGLAIIAIKERIGIDDPVELMEQSCYIGEQYHLDELLLEAGLEIGDGGIQEDFERLFQWIKSHNSYDGA